MSRSERTEEEKKTSSARLRAVFFRLWEQDYEGFPYFDDYYESKMEKLISFYKEKLN